MNISIFGYTIHLEILILIGIIYLILVSHTFCSCCSINNKPFLEGLTTIATSTLTDVSGNMLKAKTLKNKDTRPVVKAKMLKTQTTADGGAVDTTEETTTTKEGFTGANINYGQSQSYRLGENTPINTSSWMGENLTVKAGSAISPAVRAFIDRPNGPIPLPEGEMNFFENIPFSPNCCQNGGSAFSSSMGCACLNSDSYNYLVQRGGNNIPYQDI